MNLFLSDPDKKTGALKAAVNLLLLAVLLIGVFWFALERIGYTFGISFLADLHTRVLRGFGMTVGLSAAGMALSLLIGLFSALARDSRVLLLRYFSGLYITFIRGTPLIMQIYLFFYILGTAFGIENRFVAGVLILSIFEGAYIAEIIRGSLLSLDASQLEAAKAVGFTQRQTVSYVIFPQMVARTLPALTGQFASIIKDSSLLSMIAVIELTQTMRELSSANFRLFECYIFLGILYLCLTLPVTLVSKKLEKRFNYES